MSWTVISGKRASAPGRGMQEPSPAGRAEGPSLSTCVNTHLRTAERSASPKPLNSTSKSGLKGGGKGSVRRKEKQTDSCRRKLEQQADKGTHLSSRRRGTEALGCPAHTRSPAARTVPRSPAPKLRPAPCRPAAPNQACPKQAAS